jgi:hypothetical protein
MWAPRATGELFGGNDMLDKDLFMHLGVSSIWVEQFFVPLEAVGRTLQGFGVDCGMDSISY